MKKFLFVAAAFTIGVVLVANHGIPVRNGVSRADFERNAESSDALIARAFSNHRSNIQIEGRGIVSKVLPDDTNGVRHQRFILRLASGQTLLVAHNIDLAPRIEMLRTGDAVAFYGEYEWNPKGGVVHWTHRDPNGVHVGGWLQRNGRRYQ